MNFLQHVYYLNVDPSQMDTQFQPFLIRGERTDSSESLEDRTTRIIQLAIDRKYPHILLINEPIKIVNPSLLLRQLEEVNSLIDWNVVCLDADYTKPYYRHSDSCIRVYSIQNVKAYLIHSSYYHTFLNTSPQNRLLLPRADRWYMITPRSEHTTSASYL